MTSEPIFGRLVDADTDEDLGPATMDQMSASNLSEALGHHGAFRIDADGDIAASEQASVRRVWVDTSGAKHMPREVASDGL